MFDAIPLLGEKSRAWLGSVKGMPPNQVAMAATRAAQSGLMPFGDALAIKQMADRITKSGSMQGPPPGNVMNDLQMKIRSAITGQPMPQQMPPPGAMPPGAIPPGMPPPGAMPPGAPPPGAMPPPPPPAMMNAGLATLPAPALEGPPPGAPGMAAGGIVAFQEGGPAFDPFEPVTTTPRIPLALRAAGNAVEEPTEESAPEMSLADILSGAGVEDISGETYASSPEFMDWIERYRKNLEDKAAEKPSLEQFTAEERARREKSGYGQALKDRAAAIEGRGSKLEEELAKKTKLGKAAAGFRMAQAASQPGATFLGSLAEGLAGYAQTKGDLEDRMQARRDALEEQKFALAQAREDAQARGDERAEDRYNKQLAQVATAENALADLALKAEGLRIQGSEAAARNMYARGKTDKLKEYQTKLGDLTTALETTSDPALRRQIQAAITVYEKAAINALKAHPSAVGLERRIETGADQAKENAFNKAVDTALKDRGSALGMAASNRAIASRQLRQAQKDGDKKGIIEARSRLEEAKQDYENAEFEIRSRIYGGLDMGGGATGDGWAIIPSQP